MKKWLVGFLLLLLVACGSNLPETRPSDFSLHYSESGGMMPYGSSLNVNGSTAAYNIFNQGVEVQVVYELTATELDTLYQTLVDNRFDRIQTYEEEVYDRGGTSVTITADGETVNVSDGGISFIKAGWGEEYGAVVAAIGKLIQREPGPATAEILITWDDSFSMSSTALKLNLGGDFVRLSSEMNSNQAHILTNNPNGRYAIEITGYSTDTPTTNTLDLTTSLSYELVREENSVTIRQSP